MRFEAFVQSVDFLSERERSLLVVAGDEVVDNLLTHGEIGRKGISVLLRKRPDGLTLGLFVQSHYAFAQFTACLDETPPLGPRYNPDLRRWHGLGLTMCRNLTSSISYRAGEKLDRVFMTFLSQPGDGP